MVYEKDTSSSECKLIVGRCEYGWKLSSKNNGKLEIHMDLLTI